MTSAGTLPWAGSRHTALGTYVHVLVTEPSMLPEADALVRDGLQQLDRACSRFRDDSELARLPSDGRAVTVSPLLAGVVEAALQAAAGSGGLVDPTLGASLASAGYDRTLHALPKDGPAAVYLPTPPHQWRAVSLHEGVLTVPAGVALDMGASAKAWAADDLVAKVAALGTGALVNLGGDLAIAGPVPDGGWPVAISDRPCAAPFQTVTLAGGGLATSSTVARTWRRGGVVLHHILDPATGRPARARWTSVTVTAATCLEANTASTAAVVLGDRALPWLVEQGLPACLLAPDGTAVRLNGWPT